MFWWWFPQGFHDNFDPSSGILNKSWNWNNLNFSLWCTVKLSPTIFFVIVMNENKVWNLKNVTYEEES